MLWLLLYLPVTLFVHTLLHEGAHWAVIRACGGGAWIKPWPHVVAGHFFWGRTYWVVPASWGDAKFVAAYFAPVVAELVWLSGACFAFGYTDLAAFEVAAALLDILVWFLGSDGAQFHRLLGQQT